MESLDVGGMLVQPCRAMEVRVVKSATEHQRAAIRCFAKMEFRKMLVIG